MSKRYLNQLCQPNKRLRVSESCDYQPILVMNEPTVPQREMLYHEKKDLCLLIVRLDETGLQQVMDIISKEEPQTLQTQNSECTFDVNALKSRTLWLIKNFLSTWHGTTATLRESQKERARLKAVFDECSQNNEICADLAKEDCEETVDQYSFSSSEIFFDQFFEFLPSETIPCTFQEQNYDKMDLVDSFIFDDNPMKNSLTNINNSVNNAISTNNSVHVTEGTTINVNVKEEKLPIEKVTEASENDEEESRALSMTDEDDTDDSSGQESITTLVPEKDPITGKYFITIKVYDLRGGSLKCPACKKKFKDRSNLIKHVRTHTGEKPYECKHCNKSFRHTSTLKDHMNVHSQQNPYTCSFPNCGKQFANKPNLKRHERTHTGEKPFACSICGQTFSQSSNCKSHEMSHSGQPARKTRKTRC